jgi:bacterioferritin
VHAIALFLFEPDCHLADNELRQNTYMEEYMATPKNVTPKAIKTPKASSKTNLVPISPAAASKNVRKQKVIVALNQARAMELFAISQYMNQHYALDDMDYGELAAKMKLIAIDEMRHAEIFAERIKELGGEPTTESAGKLVKGQPVHQVYPYDSAVEDDTIDVYNQLLLICRENGDNISARIFEEIAAEEQIHLSRIIHGRNFVNTVMNIRVNKRRRISSLLG